MFGSRHRRGERYCVSLLCEWRIQDLPMILGEHELSPRLRFHYDNGGLVRSIVGGDGDGDSWRITRINCCFCLSHFEVLITKPYKAWTENDQLTFLQAGITLEG